MNKKILTLLGLLTFTSTNIALASDPGFIFPNGANQNSIIHASGTSLDGKTILQLAQAIDSNTQVSTNAIPKTWIGQNTTSSITGIAPLDENGNSTSPVLTNYGTFGTTYPTMFIGQDMTSVLGSPFVGNTTLQIGGSKMPTMTGQTSGTIGYPQSVVISSHPDGAFNKGCGLCLFTEGGYQNTMIAQLGGDDYESGTGLVPISFDTAGIYWEADSRNALLTLPASSYTDTTVVLSGKLSDAQVILIKQGQYIITNSTDTTDTDTETWSSPHFIAGIVKSVDNSGTNAVINVWSWNRLGQSGTSQVPSLTNLDTFYFPNTKVPTVFIGSPTKAFGFNTMMQYDGSRTGAGTTDTSSVHQLEWGEVDVNVQNETRAGSLSYHGLTFGGKQTIPTNATITASQVFTDDSYEMLLANDMPHHLEIADACGNMAIETNELYLPSACSLFDQTPVDKVYDFDMNELHQIIAGYNERLVTHITSDGKDTSSYTNATLRFGPRINGTKGNTSSTDTSSMLGEIDFPGSTGGVSLCGYGVNCGLVMDGTGNITLPVALNVSGGTTLSNQLSVKANMTITGTTYYQNSNGDNIAALAASTDSSGNNELAYSSLASGGATLLFNLPTTVGNDLTITGGITSHGNTNLGGYGGSISLKDVVTTSSDLNVNGSFNVHGNMTIGGNGGTTTLKDGVVLSSLSGTGNAYACLNASGQIYRSTTACD